MTTSVGHFRNILVATDFSECAGEALKTAVALARKCGAKLTVVHVVRDFPASFAAFDYGTGWQVTPSELERMQNELCDDAQQRLQALVAAHRQPGIKITEETLIGYPYLAIIEAVKKNGFDLVVVGTRGMSAIKRVLVGSTATRLARACPVPVWVARQPLPGEAPSILVPVDFSPISEGLLSVSTSLATSLGAKLHLLHVYDTEELYGMPPISDNTRAELSYYRRRARRTALSKLEQMLEALGINHGTATLHVAQGVPHQVISSTARGLDVGLIVMGSVGRSGISGLLIGNTAEKILHTSERSLLVVKPEGFAVELPAVEPGAVSRPIPVVAASVARRGW